MQLFCSFAAVFYNRDDATAFALRAQWTRRKASCGGGSSNRRVVVSLRLQIDLA